ncbi:MAG: SufD family Fe-S cluster assembly protein, partial [archaeon]|nr:SufD family Fe-S cluster assembly protein [archaeon]
AIFDAKPVKKSKYTDIKKLDSVLTASKTEISFATRGNGVLAMPISEALSKHSKELANVFSMEKTPQDQFGAFINANFNSGFAVFISKDNDEPATIEASLPNGACAKCVIVVEKGVRANLLEKISSGQNALLSQTVYLKEGATLSHAKINSFKENAIVCQQNILERDAKLWNANTWNGGNFVRTDNINILKGQGSEARDYVIQLLDGAQKFDMHFTALHKTRDSFSHTIFKSVLGDASSNVFDGMILIEEGADKTNALLECHSMLLDEKASSNQIPGLEIKTDDVKATHSATVARIEDEEIFYLQSRGIAGNEAKKLVVKGFLESLAYEMPNALRKALFEEIDARI